MATLPVRNLGQLGIVKDIASADLPPNAFTAGTNVRFENGKVIRAPIWRRVKDLVGENPAFCYGVSGTGGFDRVLYATDDGRVFVYTSGMDEDISPTDHTPIVSTEPFTASMLGEVVYFNRRSACPMAMTPGAIRFSTLPNWDASWRALSLRSYRDFMVAINVTKGATEFPQMVKWSDLALAGQVPGSWDANDNTNSAGENIIADLTAPLVDGGQLRDSFIIYSTDQTYLMQFVGGTFVMEFRKLFGDAGIINANCWVEVDGKHYVFGSKDIYVHDGTSKKSIAANRVRDFVYSTMNVRQANRCFVAHNPNLFEIYFCYVSGGPDTYFEDPTRCNKAAVYNYSNDTWTFADLPNVASITTANIDNVLTYSTADARTYHDVGGSYYDQEDSYQM
ncbi:hypothetical protein GAY31_20090 [Azospirillum brasilense]|nr:hypothetical protein [Azospirillum brasilense]